MRKPVLLRSLGNMKTLTHLVPTCLLAAALFLGAAARASISEYQTAVRNEAGLISYYTFDAGDAADSQSSNHGTVVGNGSFATGVGGGADRGLMLDGAGHVNLGQVDAFDFLSGTGTVEAWVRADWSSSPGYNPTLFADREGGPVNWSVHLEGAKTAAGLWNGTSYDPMAVATVGTVWHHLAVVFDYDAGLGSSAFRLYWDGVLAGTTSQGLGAAPSSPTQLGSASPVGLERWVGALDEVAFYSQALSATAIGAHYTAFLVGDPPSILTQPLGGTYLEGVPLTLSVEAKGAQLSYVWFRNETAIPGATASTLRLPHLAPADAGRYHVVVSNPAGQTPSQAAEVALGSLPTKLSQYQTAVRSESSLIAYYPFDGLTADDSKDSHPGTLEGQTQFADGIGGGAGKALVLGGAGHVNLGQVDEFDFASGLGTVEAWVRADWAPGLGYDPTVLADRDGLPVNWSLHMNRNQDGIGLWNGSTYQPPPITGPGAAWHHLAAVFDYDTGLGSFTFTLYWDGEPAGTRQQAIGSMPSAPTQLGSASAGGQERWVGALDEVAFFSEALNAATIKAHYAAFTAGDPPIITSQPQGGDYIVGDPLALTVGAQGIDLSYQWYQNGVLIPGATTAGFSRPAVATEDAGNYRVRVSSAVGFVDSDSVAVRVIVPDLARYQAAIRQEVSLISYYTFDNADLTDSESSNQGLAEGEVNYAPGVGRGADQTVLLGGVGHVNLGQSEAFDFRDNTGTVEAWVRADWTASPSYNPTLFADRDDGPVNWSVHMNAGKDGVGLWNGSTHQPLPITGTGTAWHHVAAVFDQPAGNSTFTLYWDGTAVNTTQQAIGAAPDAPTQLGSASSLGQERWIGALDEVAFYADALNADAIRAHYQALLGGAPEPPALEFTLAGGNLALAWSATVTGFTLESTDALPVATWVQVAGVVNNRVTVDASSGTRFYRLRKP